MYKDSYALVVGNGNYENGWDPLPRTVSDVQIAKRILEEHGFSVTLKTDLTKPRFEAAFEEFLRNGEDASNRILFYYAGHSSERLGNSGDCNLVSALNKVAIGVHYLSMDKLKDYDGPDYLIMVDAPPPGDAGIDELTCVDMKHLVADVTKTERVRTQHVLFLFDRTGDRTHEEHSILMQALVEFLQEKPK